MVIRTIYLKPTNYCNVGCEHCYLSGKQRRDFYFMTKENIKIIHERLEEYLIGKIKPQIILHGGEPLLLDCDTLEYIFETFKNYPLSIQTSGVPLFDNPQRNRYYEILKKYQVFVSLSYDFFGVRKYQKSAEKFEKQFLELVKELNNNGIKPAVIFTITKKIMGKERKVYEWFLKHLPLFYSVKWEEFNEYTDKPRGVYLTNKEIAKILIELYELDKQNNFKIFKYFKHIEDSLKNEMKLGAKFCTDCQMRYLVIDPNGETTNCPDKAGTESFGNIYNQSIRKILNSPKRYEWILKSFTPNVMCKKCTFQDICCGGCPLKRAVIEREKITDINNCPGFYPLLKHIKEKISED